MSLDTVSVEFKGLSAVLKRLKALPEDLQKRGLRVAMNKGARIVQKAAQSNMRQLDDPKTKEKIYKNVATIFASRTSKRTKSIVMKVGVRGGAKNRSSVNRDSKGKVRQRTGLGTQTSIGTKGNPGGDTWYWRFQEFGVPSRGIPARQPMLNALRSNVQRATDTVANELIVQIHRSMVRLGRGA